MDLMVCNAAGFISICWVFLHSLPHLTCGPQDENGHVDNTTKLSMALDNGGFMDNAGT
jgi:hypothetical protein